MEFHSYRKTKGNRMKSDHPCSIHVALVLHSRRPSAISATGRCCAKACSRARWRPRWAVGGAAFGATEGEYCEEKRESRFTRLELENHLKILSGKSTCLTNMNQTWREGCLNGHRLPRSLAGPRGSRTRAEGSARYRWIRLHYELQDVFYVSRPIDHNASCFQSLKTMISSQTAIQQRGIRV